MVGWNHQADVCIPKVPAFLSASRPIFDLGHLELSKCGFRPASFKKDLWEFWIPSPWINRGKIRKVESEYCVFSTVRFLFTDTFRSWGFSRWNMAMFWSCWAMLLQVVEPELPRANAGGDASPNPGILRLHSNLRVMEYGGFLQWGCPGFLLCFF